MSTRFHLSVSVNQGYNEVRWVKDFVWPQGLIVSLNLLQAVKNRDFFFYSLFYIDTQCSSGNLHTNYN